MTSKLEQYLSNQLYTRFGHLSIRQNYRPDWLNGLELDFYVDELKLAAEVQGDQHYKFVEYFHKTPENFEAQKDRDALKSILCRENGIELIEIFTETDADLFTKRIGGHKEQHPKSMNIFLEDQDAVLVRAIKLAKRAIRKEDGTRNGFLHSAKKVATVYRISRKRNIAIKDEIILRFYKENQLEVNGRL